MKFIEIALECPIFGTTMSIVLLLFRILCGDRSGFLVYLNHTENIGLVPSSQRYRSQISDFLTLFGLEKNSELVSVVGF